VIRNVVTWPDDRHYNQFFRPELLSFAITSLTTAERLLKDCGSRMDVFLLLKLRSFSTF